MTARELINELQHAMDVARENGFDGRDLLVNIAWKTSDGKEEQDEITTCYFEKSVFDRGNTADIVLRTASSHSHACARRNIGQAVYLADGSKVSLKRADSQGAAFAHVWLEVQEQEQIRATNPLESAEEWNPKVEGRNEAHG